MKNMCNIIRDLLPLYAEGIASADTVAFVEDHLGRCAQCRAALDNMKMPNDAEHSASDLPDSSALPLKAFRRKWNRKKALLVCATILVTAAVMCFALFSADRILYQEKIEVNGAVYTQTDAVVVELPPDSPQLGYVRGISLRSTGDPMGNFMATNLDKNYGGCAIFQSGENDQIIYLQDAVGVYIPFELTKTITPSETGAE